MQLKCECQPCNLPDFVLVPALLGAQTPVEGFAETRAQLPVEVESNINSINSIRRLQEKNSKKHGRFEISDLQRSCQHTRDHLLEFGSEGISDSDLLELLLSFVQPGVLTRSIAKQLINQFGSLANVLTAQILMFERVPGMRRQGIAALKVVHAAAVRLARSEVKNRPILSNWDALMGYLNAVLARERVEQVRILFLDCSQRLMADEVLWRGTINHAPVYPREIVRRALELQSAAIILAHNHPSGDPTPSQDDIVMTQQVIAAATTLSITVQDHVIIGNGTWVSFRNEGLI